MTEPEESVLVTMARFFIENGWIDDDTQSAFDTLIEKICEPCTVGLFCKMNETLGQVGNNVI